MLWLFSRCGLAKQVGLRWADQNLRGAFIRLIFVSAQMHGRNARSFFHQQTAGSRELICERDYGVMQLATAEVVGPTQIEHRVDPCHADANVSQPVAPWTPEGVGHHHCGIGAAQTLEAIANLARLKVGIFR